MTDEIENRGPCPGRDSTDTNMCSYHICVLDEGHDGLCECKCGFCWDINTNPVCPHCEGETTCFYIPGEGVWKCPECGILGTVSPDGDYEEKSKPWIAKVNAYLKKK